MADHSRVFRLATRPALDDDKNKSSDCIPPIRQTESNDSSCNLSASWIDLETEAVEHDLDDVDTMNSIRENFPIDVDDLYFVDPFKSNPCEGEPIRDETGGNCHHAPQDQRQQPPFTPLAEGIPNQEEPSDIPNPENSLDENDSHQPYVEIIDTHVESIEGYDWDGILDLRNRMKKQQQQQQESVTALQSVTEFRLYLTDGLLEESTEEASLALDDARRYEVVDDTNDKTDGNQHPIVSSNGGNGENDVDEDDFVEFVESSARTEEMNIAVSNNANADSSPANGNESQNMEEDEYASLALSPLDVLTNSLLGSMAFHRNHSRHSVRLTELIVGGPSLKLGEASLERLARALTCGGSGGGLKKLVLIVSAVDLTAMKALGECIRATSDSLQDLHFYASQTTERLVASRKRYKNVPAPSVLGPGISSWVDAWTCNPNNCLRSLNLSRMDIGDEAAFALSRLLLAAPKLTVLNLAQDDFYASPQGQEKKDGDSHLPLSFAGTKRLLESLILIEDIKRRSLTTGVPLSCANLLELDLSGWVLEEDERKTDSKGYDMDDDKAIDNFYDDYNYVDDGSGEDGFEFADSSSAALADHKRATRKNQRACCVIASMLRVNTTLQKLVLVAEDGSTDASIKSEIPGRSRGFLSVRSTLAIARALRDHVSISTKVTDNTGNDGRRPLGSNLRTLVLSTNYTRGMTRSKIDDASSWAITERKRAVAKVLYQALRDRAIHQLRLEKLSCTPAFKGLDPLGASPNANGLPPTPFHDLRDQLEFFLKENRNINQSLKNIDSLWLPRLSSLDAAAIPDTIIDEEDEDCHFVEATDIEDDSSAVAATRRLKDQGQKKPPPPPVLILALPVLLAKAGKEAASYDVVFSCARVLATKTNLWEVACEHRCEPQFRYRANRGYE